MKIKELFEKVDKSEEIDGTPNYEYLCTELNLDCHWFEENRIKSYFYMKWLCTDTWVGGKVHFFDDKPMALSFQEGRKCSTKFWWVSKEIREEVKKYLKELIEKMNKEEPDNFSSIDLDEEVGSTYHLSYACQILEKRAIYNGKEVELVVKREKSKLLGTEEVVYIIENGKEIKVDVKELKFNYNLKK